MKSWKTTFWGIVGMVALLSGAAWSFHTTGQLPDLGAVLSQLGALAAGVGLIAAKDHSEE